MKLLLAPFERMKNGVKTLELRLYDEKRKKINVGDLIIFQKLPDLNEKIYAKVTGLLIYDTFRDLIDDIPASYLGYEESEKSYLKESMYGIYTKEEEKQYGALGIKISLI